MHFETDLITNNFMPMIPNYYTNNNEKKKN